MAGSYGHVVQRSGDLASGEIILDMLENGGDVIEAVEEMYGMIWFLAWQGVAPHIPFESFKSLQYVREMVKDAVGFAQANYQKGLEASTVIHHYSPDTGR